MTYGAERVDAQALDQLEAILRTVADELAGWRARAHKAEADLKEAGGPGSVGDGGGGGPRVHGVGKSDAEARHRVGDLEAENRALRQRVEAARHRVQDLLGRLTFLEEQAREPGRGGAGGGGGGGGGGGADGSPG
ncbi:MAG: hypothetical protein ACREL9_08245, partial [Gemmatimonadales bacterium]